MGVCSVKMDQMPPSYTHKCAQRVSRGGRLRSVTFGRAGGVPSAADASEDQPGGASVGVPVRLRPSPRSFLSRENKWFSDEKAGGHQGQEGAATEPGGRGAGTLPLRHPRVWPQAHSRGKTGKKRCPSCQVLVSQGIKLPHVSKTYCFRSWCNLAVKVRYQGRKKI